MTQNPNESRAASDTIRYLLDRQEIQDVIARYALGQDSHQGNDSEIRQQWDEVFTTDGTADYSASGAPAGSYRDLALWMRGDGKTPGRMDSFSNWQHMLSLPVVTIEGDTATARTDYLATHRGHPGRGFNVHFNASGAFHDVLVRTEKGWRIKHRSLEVYFADPLMVGVPATAEITA
jgi:hypothetical protein